MKPGESDCDRCLLRPRAEGGNGACPYRDSILQIMRERKDCLKFREGDYKPRIAVEQTERLF